MKRAFTLVEMLVVLAIVSVLAAILFGVFGRVREKGRQATCQSNLKQIDLALQSYVQDNAGVYPPWADYTGKTPVFGWGERIGSYLKTNAVFQCPSEPTSATDDPTLPREVGIVPSVSFSDYGYNIWLTSESVLAFPERTIVLNDTYPQPAWADGQPLNKEPIEEVNKDFYRHFGGVNYTFADGHIKWFTLMQIYYLGGNSTSNRGCILESHKPTFCTY